MNNKSHPNGIAHTKPKTRIVWRGFFVRIFILFFLVGVGYMGYFGYKIYRVQNKIVQLAPVEEQGGGNQVKGIMAAAKSMVTHERIALRGEKNGRINILLLGMGGEGHKGKHLTDTIMLVSIDPDTYESAMFSIPRDLYVKIPESGGIHTKINAVYTYELRNQQSSVGESFASMKKVIKSITGEDVHYYLALDFEGFKEVINELGGVDVEVEDDIYDSSYPGPNYSYETFEISKGFRHLDAETALKYSRVRHTKGGDFGRAKRQQQVIASAKRKAFSLKTIANPTKIATIMDVLGENMKTDIQFAEIPSFIHFANNINIYKTTNKVLDAWSPDSLLGSTHVEMGGVQAYVLIPRAKNYSQVYELVENIFDLEKIKQKEILIENEKASVVTVSNNSRDYYKIKNIFNKLGYKTVIEKSANSITCDQDKNTIISFANQPKLFTLDDLASKLDAEIKYADSPQDEDSFDIGICLSENTVKYFEKQYQSKEDYDRELEEKAILSENGNVLYSTEENK